MTSEIIEAGVERRAKAINTQALRLKNKLVAARVESLMFVMRQGKYIGAGNSNAIDAFAESCKEIGSFLDAFALPPESESKPQISETKGAQSKA